MPPPHHYRIYSDESCINQSDYIVIGATVGAPEVLRRMERDIEARPEVRSKVMKWEKTKSGKLSAHKAAIDVFFDYNARRLVDFHCLVLEAARVNYRKHSGGDSELGFGKFMFQLYLSMKNFYGAESTYHCFPDFRDTRYDLQSLKRALNARLERQAIRNKWMPVASFREIEWCDEEDCRTAQVNDLLTGAVGFLVNRRTQLGKDRSKAMLAQHVLERCPHTSLAEHSPGSEWHFRIWHYDLGVDPRA